MPLPSPSPAATITVMEMMPQAMPNIVSTVRRLWAQSVASVSRSKSWNDMALRLSVRLLQNHFLLLVEAFENLRLHAVGNAQLHAEFFLAVVGLGVWDLHGGFSLFVINQPGFRNDQDGFLFCHHNLGVRSHRSLPLPALCATRTPHLTSSDVHHTIA